MGTWKNVAVIQIDQTLIVQEVPDVHLPVDQHQVDLQADVHLPVDQHQVDLQMVVHLPVVRHLPVRQAVAHLHDLVPLIHLAVQLDLILQGLHHDHQDQIQVDVAKIYLRAVVLHHDQVHRVEIAKVAM
jgi:hypothetical protein